MAGASDAREPTEPGTVWTIGHSTRTLEEFLALLEHHRIGAIADVRRYPASRRHPQFAREPLAASLEAAGIEYRWLPQLGGRRRARKDSPNTAWRSESFRGYADHLASAEFAEGLEGLVFLAGRRPTAIMCAELLWWRCHRQLIADVLKARGAEVLHIVDGNAVVPHPWSSAARLVGGRLDYGTPAIGDLFGG